MPQELRQTGNFRGEIREYSLKYEQSGAIAVVVHAAIRDVWNPETKEWEDWRQHDLQVVGYQYIILTNGAINERTIAALVSHTGWDGNIESVSAGTWKPTPCRFSVEENEWNNNISYRIGWINSYDSQPGTSNVTPEKARELQNKFGSQLRAVAGNAVRNALTPAAPATPQAPVTTPAMQPEGTAEAEKDIPF